MAQTYEYDDNGNLVEIEDKVTGPKALRDQNEKLNKQLKDLQTQFDQLSNERGQNSLKSYLSEKGLRPSIAKWISKDGVDPTDTRALDQWIADNADEFNLSPVSTDADTENDAANERQRMNDTQAQGARSGDRADIFAKIANAKTQEEITALLKEIPV